MRTYPALLVRLSGTSEDPADLVAAAVDGLDALALDETADGQIRVFFNRADLRDAARDSVRATLPGASVKTAEVSDEDWAERSQAALRAVRAGALRIAPPWDAQADDSTTVVILPSMGFGTGHHATTRLCLLALQRADPSGRSVIDIGTGSGVLAIAAAKLGAARVVGIDNDPDAIANAIENLSLNDVNVEFRCASFETAELQPADIVLANLTGAVLIRVSDELSRLRRSGGHLILSGLREEEEDDVVRAFGGHPAARAEEDGWVCLRL